MFAAVIGVAAAVHLKQHQNRVELLASDHVYSSWDTADDAPVPGCYTQALYNVLLESAVATELFDAPVVMFGLGGGVLSARLARDGIRTRVVELSDEVMDTYDRIFLPRLVAWAPAAATHVTVHKGDAFSTEACRDDTRWVVVDVPSCYRDASIACVRLVRRLCNAGVGVVVNVWFNKARTFASRAPSWGSFLGESDNGAMVWACKPRR